MYRITFVIWKRLIDFHHFELLKPIATCWKEKHGWNWMDENLKLNNIRVHTNVICIADW